MVDALPGKELIGTNEITGDATPFVLHYSEGPLKVKCLTPNAKLIVLLRNPVDRAYSHYCHHKKFFHFNYSKFLLNKD